MRKVLGALLVFIVFAAIPAKSYAQGEMQAITEEAAAATAEYAAIKAGWNEVHQAVEIMRFRSVINGTEGLAISTVGEGFLFGMWWDVLVTSYAGLTYYIARQVCGGDAAVACLYGYMAAQAMWDCSNSVSAAFPGLIPEDSHACEPW